MHLVGKGDSVMIEVSERGREEEGGEYIFLPHID